MPDSAVSIGQVTPRDIIALLVSKRNGDLVVKLISKHYYLFQRGDHVSARNGGAPPAAGAARASRRLRRRTQPRAVDGAPFFCPRQRVLPDPVGVRGISSNDPWHRIASY